jgi:dihydrofolate synthase/folylpolyglutamate synthase
MPHSRVPLHNDAYAETYEFLCSLERFGILLGLENITSLMEKIGNPHLAFPVIHIAGSNGKGSTAATLTQILREAGYKTALYTSPHLNDFRERIRLDGELVSKEAVIDATAMVKAVYDPERTTFFEFTTAVAFACIRDFRPDAAIVEVGLGGRLDATNVVHPMATVITDISREHEDYLGVGIANVAREKAGIIKQGAPLITGAVRRAALAVIGETARQRNAAVRLFGRDFVGVRTGPATFTYRSPRTVLEHLEMGMAGGHQVKNASLALAAAEELMTRGFSLSPDHLRAGVRKVKFPGRFELVRRSPDVIIDGAHTPESMRLLKSLFTRVYPGMRPYTLMGMLREKNYQEMARILLPMSQETVCVAPQGPRALPAAELAAYAAQLGYNVSYEDDIDEGLRKLLRKASPRDVILASGSLYMIGPVRRACGLKDE